MKLIPTLLLFILLSGAISLKAQSLSDVKPEDYGDKSAEMMLHDELRDFYHNVNEGRTTPEDILFLKYLESHYRDTLVVNRAFSDKNGRNQLEIIVYDNCNDTLEIEEGFRVDGLVNCVTARITNEKSSDNLRYYNPDVAMSLLYLKKQNITTKDIDGKMAVFVPMIYCGTSDDEIWVSYILAYNGRVYLKHIHAQGIECDFCNYQLDDNLEEKLKDLPPELKVEFTGLLLDTVFDDL